jgi:hypothetical protein
MSAGRCMIATSTALGILKLPGWNVAGKVRIPTRNVTSMGSELSHTSSRNNDTAIALESDELAEARNLKRPIVNVASMGCPTWASCPRSVCAREGKCTTVTRWPRAREGPDPRRTCTLPKRAWPRLPAPLPYESRPLSSPKMPGYILS